MSLAVVPPNRRNAAQDRDDSKLERQLKAARDENKSLKRKLDQASGGKGDGKRSRGGDNVRNKNKDLPPPEVRRASADDGSRICWPFNKAKGCGKGRPGQTCPLGKHVCLLCAPDANHSCADTTCPRRR